MFCSDLKSSYSNILIRLGMKLDYNDYNVLFQPTMLQLVPPLISYLGNEKKLNLKAFERMHTIMSGAAPLGPATANKLLEKLRNPGITLQEGM